MNTWKPAKKKLTKSQKNRGRDLREEIEWLEKKLRANHPIMDEVTMDYSVSPIMVTRTQNGRADKLWAQLEDMKQELKELYEN